MISWEIFINIIGYCLVILSFVIFFYFFNRKFVRQIIEKEIFKKRSVELEEADYTKQIFLTAMSHQLHTSLVGAKWSIETILKDKTFPPYELLEESHNRIIKAIEIIDKILKTAELEVNNKNIKLKKDKFDLKQLVDKIISGQSYLIKSKGIKLIFERYESVFIEGDEKMLHLSLTNIIDNAIRYSPHGIVKFNLFNIGTDVFFVVEDNGVGIDPKDLEFITYQKFYRGKNAMKIDPNESGVGLYITKKILQIHGGKIGISSTLGKGTKVSVTLPTTHSV